MHEILRRILAVFAGALTAFVLYVGPDLAANLGETNSFTLKAVCAVVLFALGVAAWRKRRIVLMKFALAACFVLVLLLLFGGAIRLAETGAHLLP